MKTELSLMATVVLALAACGRTPVETGTDTDSGSGTDTQSSVSNTYPTEGPGSNSASDTDTTTGSASGMSNSGMSQTDPDPDTTASPTLTETAETTNTTPATPGTSDTETTVDPDTTMGVDDTASSSESSTSSSSGDEGSTSSSSGDTGTSTTETTDETTEEPNPCGEPVLHAVIRDFAFAHPDFEDYGGNSAFTGLVQDMLGADNKPVYAHPGPTAQTTGPAEFAQWYNDAPNVNQTFMVDLPLTDLGNGTFQFLDDTFFPIDNLGFGNEGQPNNFAFTTEIHTTFKYNGGETFTFKGDDDVWVFINKRLAIDLGGLHPQLEASISLDAAAAALGITPGLNYPMDLFHAERHTNESHFRIDTTIACFVPQ